ncbi:hypothetical protein FSP39_011522 [Pinctada imbricata]|uniref:Uncharacterized protein n=1 Tax=Pinctada imbricata TaxID=66713 RepID=A0AA88Y4D9_PINIB|nr:hypothetical protein FSP39_011522 [Pinctada imbricata]
MNYGTITPDLDADPDDIPLDEGIDYGRPSTVPANFEYFTSISGISKQSLCSALGSYMAIRGKTKHLVDATLKTAPDYEIPLHKLRGLRGVYKSGLISYSNDMRTRDAVNKLLKWESSVYRHRKESPQLRGGARNAQTLQNKPFHSYFEHSFHRENSLPAIHFNATTKYNKGYRNIPSIQVQLSEPRFPRSIDGRPLLRRPPSKSTDPVTNEDPRFEQFWSRMALKEKKFRTPNEQFSYYEVNYPLLLHSNLADTKPDRKPKQQQPQIPDITENPELQRKLKLKSRINNLDDQVNVLEEETTDIDFRTELRDEVFDPTTYEWNKSKYSETPPITPPVSPQSANVSDQSSTSSPRSMSS